jgi:hypothetical protein
MIEITPKTKVGELLEHHPHLEAVLLELSPAFASLKNPILRRTVARVASLQQAAALGNMKIEELVNRLRSEAGQEPLFGAEPEQENVNEDMPSWFIPEKVSIEFDAREMIQSGDSPMIPILEQVKSLKKGEIYKLLTPFVPAPILDRLRAKGYICHSQRNGMSVVSWITPG